jgi:glucose-6-phosphate 1-dehydrogenase
MKDAARSDALVFFGATGDLAHKMIFPALQALVKTGRLDIPVIGVAKAGWSLDQLRARARDSLEKFGGGVDTAAFARLSERLGYVDGDYREARTFDLLRQALGSAKHPLHYLAIPPSVFPTVIGALDRSGAARGARVIVEKPFGRDLASARDLNRTLRGVFDESAIFRIDHFLGKEPVQNLLYFRFSNSMLEPIWNRNYVASMHLTLAESFGIRGRGRLYEETGAIRDVIENHMLQVLASLTVEPPASNDASALRHVKAHLLEAITPLAPADVVRGQFDGYRSELGVAADSQVETFAAARFAIDNWRWAGVPFYVRSGKCLPVTCTEVLVQLKPPPRSVFGEDLAHLARASHVRFRIAPDVTIALGMRSKVPGESMVGCDVELVATRDSREAMHPYERLLGDAMDGDPTLFASEDVVEAEWRAVDGILGNVAPLHMYRPGTWGPTEAERLIEGAGGWQNPRPPFASSH